MNGAEDGWVPPDATDEQPRQARPGYPMTDLGNARWLVARAGAGFRWCGAMPGNGWLVWDGARWTSDDTRAITRAALEIGDVWRDELNRADDDAAKSIRRHVDKSESASGVRAMIELAGADAAIVTRRDQYDANDWLLNTPTATYDLRKLTAHKPRQTEYITKIAGVNAAKSPECPQWLAFLDRIMGGDEYMVAFLQRVVGYCLTGSTSEQCMFIAYGRGANGKSTFMAIVQHILGEYAKQTAVETFTARREGGIPNDIAALAGARLVTCNEASEDSGLDEAVVKAATGGDPLVARFLNREFFSYTPTFKLWMLTNHKPIIRGTDEGIWRRLRLIPFAVTIPKPERDGELLNKLKLEAPAILRWSLDGLKSWHVLGLDPPPQVIEATESYRKDMDALADFLADRCAVEATGTASNSEVYSSYVEWAKDNGQKPMSHKRLTRKLSDRGFVQSARKDVAKRWEGLRLVVSARESEGMFKRRGYND